MNYRETLDCLFSMLAQANLADSDDSSLAWQATTDASQRVGYYGHLRNAIVAIAGEAIVEHWVATNEVDYALACRASKAGCGEQQ